MKLENANAIPHGPAGVCPSFVLALSQGDLRAAAACFARDGCLITPDVTAIHGRDSVRAVLAQMVIEGTKVLVETSHSVSGGKVILARERWRVRAGDPEGRQTEQVLDAILVLRWIEDNWRLAIAAPWGWGVAAL